MKQTKAKNLFIALKKFFQAYLDIRYAVLMLYVITIRRRGRKEARQQNAFLSCGLPGEN